MSWFTKHRPRKIKDLDIESVKDQFLKMMQSASFPQAMIFAGPKGTGKTSSARIIGAILNDPQNDEVVDSVYFKKKSLKKSLQEADIKSPFAEKIYSGSSYVVYEIDAASNRGIDDIRSLKEKAFVSPLSGKMSVFILDEAHMLTKEAFNALLKILEEPPKHCIFILATTEFHKIPSTVASRALKLSFRKATKNELISSMKRVLDQEKIKYSQEALELIATRADGSFRDAVKILEMAASFGKIDLEEVTAVIGSTLDHEVTSLLSAVIGKDDYKLAEVFSGLRQQQVDEQVFIKVLYSYLHKQLMINIGIDSGTADFNQKICIYLLNKLMLVDFNLSSPIPFLQLEVFFLDLVFKARKNGNNEPKDKSPSSKKKIKKKQIELKPELNKPLNSEVKKIEDISEIVPTKDSSESWLQLIKRVSDSNLTLSALLKSSKFLGVDQDSVNIGLYYKFHISQINQIKYSDIIQNHISKIFGPKYKFNCTLLSVSEMTKATDQTESLTEMVENVLM